MEIKKPFRGRPFGLLLALSVAVHGAVAVGAACWIVARAWKRPPVALELAAERPPAGLPPAEEGGGGGAPETAPAEVLLSTPVPLAALPALPPMPLETWPAAVPAAALGKGDGNGAGTSQGAGAGTGNGAGLGLSLFGIEEAAGRAVIALDVSDSIFVREKGAFAGLCAEVQRAIDGLSPGGSFDLIVFADASQAWQPELVPADEAHRRHARAWFDAIAAKGRSFVIEQKGSNVLFEGSGSRGDTMLKQAFSLQPDRIALLTDGQWDVHPTNGRSLPLGAAELDPLLERLEAGRPAPVPIDVLYLHTRYSKPEEAAAMRTLAARSGGRFVQVEGVALARGGL